MSAEMGGNHGSAQAGNSVDGGLRRVLTSRHIQTIVPGGAIGTGLLYDSATGTRLAGPPILLAYVLCGAVIFFVVHAMGEMSVRRPSSGSFSRYANDYWSPRAGLVAGWNYWFNYIAVVMAKLAVVGQYIQYWFLPVPAWISAAAMLLVITAVNLVGVRTFDKFGFRFAIARVAAAIGMTALGLYVIAARANSNPHLPDPSFSHLLDCEGFFPRELGGPPVSLAFVMFSFGGIEPIGIAADEAENSQRFIPKAANQMVYHVLIFYISALFVVIAAVPWDVIDDKLSPSARVFNSVGIEAAAHMLNFVVLAAALSAYNSGLYSSGRTPYSFAWQGNAPRAFIELSHHGIPHVDVLFSPLVTVTAVAIVYSLPEIAFTIVISTVLVSGIISWAITLITRRKFGKAIGPQGKTELSFELPGDKATDSTVFATLGGFLALMAFSADYRMVTIVLPIWLAILFVAYEAGRRRSGPGGLGRNEDPSGQAPSDDTDESARPGI